MEDFTATIVTARRHLHAMSMNLLDRKDLSWQHVFGVLEHAQDIIHSLSVDSQTRDIRELLSGYHSKPPVSPVV